jgi:hypothetical protein
MCSQNTLSALLLIFIFSGVNPAWAAEPVDSDCLECHGEASRSDALQIPLLESQILPGSVHIDLTCVECHADITSLPHSQPLQRTDCSSCHEKQADAYRRSVHGLRPFAGDIEREAEEAAKCIDCHGTHDITSPSDPISRVAPRNIPTTCAACHEEESVASKYGLQTRRFSTYLSSYHGVVNRYGGTAVANCASCHGIHDIHPSTDPRSAIHPDNLGNTCGACHPGVEESLAGVRIHVEPTLESSRGMYYVRTFYTYFIGGLMICFVAYMTIEIYGTLRRRRS